ncbi:hypothetical protein D3C87_1694530 [compost metagenome]
MILTPSASVAPVGRKIVPRFFASISATKLFDDLFISSRISSIGLLLTSAKTLALGGVRPLRI